MLFFCDMNPPLVVRLMSRTDLPFAEQVRALAGWNQTLDDWKRFLETEPEGCFLAEWNGQPAGTATATVYGPELAWIGMVLVHPDFRRRGIGKALMEQGIQYLRGRGVRCIKLDATPLGKKVYDNLGFKDEWTLSRWVIADVSPPTTPPDARIRDWRPADGPLVEGLDSAAFGVSRQKVIQALAPQSRCALVFESEPGRIEAFGMLRKGARALYLGPATAAAADTGISLIKALLARGQGEPVFWDIPDQNVATVAWAKQAGFTWQRSLIRMYLGAINTPGNPQNQAALAGPEIG